MIRPHLRLAVLVALGVLATFGSTEGARAHEIRLTNIRVGGGEANWHSQPAFRIDWDQVPPPPAEPSAILSQIFDSEGSPIGPPVRHTEGGSTIDPLRVPDVPGVYRAEIWLEDAQGEAGPRAEVTLRFDDVAPASPTPIAPLGWLAGSAAAQLEIGHPPSPLPMSGVAGYAISLDRGEPSNPCAARSWCDRTELDLPGGIGDDTISLGTLPEGVTWARVVAVSGSGVPSTPASVAFQVDATRPELSLLGIPEGWSRAPVRVAAVATDAFSGMTPSGPLGAFTAIAIDGGAPGLSYGASTYAWVRGDGVHTIAAQARDAAGNISGEGTVDAGARVAIDESPPQVAFAPRQDPLEPERIEAIVDDSVSGPSTSAGVIALRPAGSRNRYLRLPTRPSASGLVAEWNSDGFPAGKYEFLATAYDQAGNSASTARRTFGGPMVLVNPVKEPVRLGVGFGTARSHATNQRFGRRVLFAGRLVTDGGQPLGGRELTIAETFAPGAQPRQRVSRVTTRADGSFSVYLGRGPSRTVSASFGGTRLLTACRSEELRLGVRGSVRLHASAPIAKVGGAPIVFRGRVATLGVSMDEGKRLPVQLQFRYPGADWSEFRTVVADARGRFRYPYRFSDDDSRGVHFQFRALIRSEDGWPYEPAASRPVIVTGA
jgi:hypothetical protein